MISSQVATSSYNPVYQSSSSSRLTCEACSGVKVKELSIQSSQQVLARKDTPSTASYTPSTNLFLLLTTPPQTLCIRIQHTITLEPLLLKHLPSIAFRLTACVR